MSTFSYTGNFPAVRSHKVEERKVSDKEWWRKWFKEKRALIERDIGKPFKFDPQGIMTVVDEDKMVDLHRGKFVGYSLGKDEDGKEKWCFGQIFRRRGATIIAFRSASFFNCGLDVITILSNHPEWQKYQQKLAGCRLAKMEKKIRRRSKRLFNYIDEVKKKRREWSADYSSFHQKRIEITGKYKVTKREFMHLMKTYFPLLEKAEPMNYKRESGD